MSLNSEIGNLRGRMSILKGIVLDNLTKDSPSYTEQWKKYEDMKEELDALRQFRNENPIRHVKCEKPWSREFFGHFPGSYEFCNVLEMWIDADDTMLACLAERNNGEQFFAVPKYNHFGQCSDYDLSTPLELAPYYRNKHRELIERTCSR